MPTISMFYGIIFRTYCVPKEHYPPHTHIYYQDYTATIDIKTGELIDGDFPKNKPKIAMAWLEIRREELLADWELASNDERPFNVEPLKLGILCTMLLNR